MNLEEIQRAVRERGFDAWLFYDHHHRDPIAYRVLGISESLMVTRRWFYLVPANGEPRKLVHRIEAGHLDNLPGSKRAYSSWQELQGGLQEMVTPYKRLAMQYSPMNVIPYIGLVDAGTVEMVRTFGNEVLSSADLVSLFEAVLTDEQIASHFAARDRIDPITAAAFQEIGSRVSNGGTHEYEIQRWILEAFRRDGITTVDAPIVAVNAHAGDPHYEPRPDRSSPMKRGDFVLLDIWGRIDTPNTCFYDITWTGVIGTPTERQQEVFHIVRDARKAGVHAASKAFADGRKIRGWEVDKATRDYIAGKGFAEYFVHRTGHSITSSIHGNGANMDNLETKDEREILPNTCFSIEPGIYLPEFGVRSEVNMITRPGKAEVTGREQEELVIV